LKKGLTELLFFVDEMLNLIGFLITLPIQYYVSGANFNKLIQERDNLKLKYEKKFDNSRIVILKNNAAKQWH